MATPTPAVRAALRRRRIAAGAGLGALLLATAGGTTAMVGSVQAAPTCTAPRNVTVATTDEMYDLVFAQARKVENQRTVCVHYDVRNIPSSTVDLQLKTGAPEAPDIWIPDASLWVNDVSSKLGDGWVNVIGTVATSPVVLGVPTALKGDPLAKPVDTWANMLARGGLLTVQDPGSTSSALTTMQAANNTSLDHDKRTKLLRSVLQLSRGTMSMTTLSQRATQGPGLARIFPLSEQQLIAYDRSAKTPLDTLVPAQGATQMDYPYVTTVKADPVPAPAARALYSALTSPDGTQALTKAGFRTPARDGRAPAYPSGSPLGRDLKLVPPISVKQTVASYKAWVDLARDARMLVLIDVSGSMSTPVNAGSTRIDLLVGTAVGALGALPPTTQLGAWAFSTNLQGKGKDWVPLSNGINTIGGTPAGLKYRDQLTATAKTLPKYVARNGDTALYDTIWAAYQYSTKTYDNNYVNSVVVLTDGTNDDPGGGLDLKGLIANLKKQYRADRPVKIVTIAMGTDTDPTALKQIATSTDGLSYTTRDPSEITSVFVDAFLQRN
ncbi:VWA domain-containing protein [Calidifontibacter sp. DB0510]|uniref:VWA domain-containing protein n=1 Tax=Metallococcus carri TaxID=1656884 RepID=A0A967B6K6_9MICO|nr:substrate-binding and VWA domain-containing protein [Metallococcus carri]NHN55631.1 VWA domain-containing protein [Metallococcus carri]NOP38185.1 VWA domain-containing protein [Calidifontibacter sp. DB2511S]